MTQKLPNHKKFQFLTEKHIKAHFFQLTRWQTSKLRDELPKGIYWVQFTIGGSYYWNWTLLQDYLLQGNRPEHQSLVEEFLASISSATGGKNA
jgi:hypothetical protein